LDRDGTLIADADYLRRLEDLELLPGVPDALQRLRKAGYLCLVVTNQSGVARGYCDLAFVDTAHRELEARLRAEGSGVDGFYVCPHHPDYTGVCACRKPAPGMLHEAAAQWGLDLSRSWVVGDKPSDVELARNAGCLAALVRTGSGRETERELARAGLAADVVADDLTAAVEEILKR
jgi:D-glycero-D-manno-heptose 1,7-bisphosphate phosphatase